MTERLPPKAPGEVLDYEIDGADLLADGETFVSADSDVVVTGAVRDSIDWDDDKVTLWLSGGTAGTPIRLQAVLKTSAGRTYRPLYIIPFGEPVSIAQAKAHCRIDDASIEEAALIAGYITAARENVENFTSQVLVRREFVQVFDAFGLALELYKWPVAEEGIEIAYVDASGAGQVYADFTAQIGRNPARLYPARDGWWPTLGRYGQVSVTYTAGYAEGEVPAALVQAMLVTISAMYDGRGGDAGLGPSGLPEPAENLCWPFRRISL